jgi:hypothetical protein
VLIVRYGGLTITSVTRDDPMVTRQQNDGRIAPVTIVSLRDLSG